MIKKLISRKKKENIVEKIEQKKNNEDYRKLAEAVLTKFGVKNIENLSDEKLLEEFSKLPHPNTIWQSSTIFPAGDISKSVPLDRIDGIIMAAWFAPDFVKTIISDREFLDIWKRERNKKIENEENTINSNEASTDAIFNLLLEMDNKFTDTITENDTTIEVIDIVKLLEELDKKYTDYLKENFGISNPPSFLEILSTFVMSINIDNIGDFFALSEQKIINDQKKTYIEIVESEQLLLNEIISDFNIEENEDEENEEEYSNTDNTDDFDDFEEDDDNDNTDLLFGENDDDDDNDDIS